MAHGGRKPRPTLIFSPGTSPRYNVSPKSRGVSKAQQSVRGALRTLRSGRRGERRKKVSPLAKYVNRAVREALDLQMAVLSLKSPDRPHEDSAENNNTEKELQETSPQEEKKTTNAPAAPAVRSSTRTRRPTAKAEEEATAAKPKRGRPKKK